MEPTSTSETSAQKIQFLFDSIASLPFGCAMLDSDQHVSFASNFLLQLFHFEKSPATFAEIAERLQGFDLKALYMRALASGAVAEERNVSFVEKTLHIYAIPVLHESKNIGGMILIEDITEQKDIEKRKDEFFAVASHELRMPLVAIRDNSELMIQHYFNQLPNKDMQEMITDIDKASIRLIGIVNNFLEVSKMENGKIEMKKETFSIADVITEVVKDFTDVAQKKGLSLTATAIGTLPQVSADHNRTEQVLVNFVSNAIKYTEHGSVTVSAALEAGMIAVRVSDTGAGISDAFKSHLFKKFEQAEGIDLAQHISKGSGLGLYISKLLVENMGGMIELEKTAAGEGSTFVFTLPAVK